MSHEAVAAVLDLHQCGPVEKAVFIAIAERADSRGRRAFPSLSDVARRSGAARNTVKAAIERGVAGGVLIPRGDRGWDVEIDEPKDLRRPTAKGRIGLAKAHAGQSLTTPRCSVTEQAPGQSLTPTCSVFEHEPPLTSLEPPYAPRLIVVPDLEHVPAKARRSGSPKGSPIVAKKPKLEEARAITKSWWDAQPSKPVYEFIAVAKIVDRFLQHGDSPSVVLAALSQAPVITVASMELTMTKLRRSMREVDVFADPNEACDADVDYTQSWADEA